MGYLVVSVAKGIHVGPADRSLVRELHRRSRARHRARHRARCRGQRIGRYFLLGARRARRTQADFYARIYLHRLPPEDREAALALLDETAAARRG
jgi:hypothetical protein